LLRRNDCCVFATVGEHLPDIRVRYCLRRFFATPLDEIITS
jgi:hypothetical protein